MQPFPSPTNDSTAIVPSKGLQRGTALILPGYQILDKVGEGTIGVTFRALQLSLNRIVAVKILHATSSSSTSLPTFLRETRLLASLSHPHIVAFHDCVQHDGRFFVVTEFISGSPLCPAMIPGEPWPIDKAAETLDRIAQALIYLHEHGVLHLDLKPENVLCTLDGNVKVADFGLAQARVDAKVLSELGVAPGSLNYCSPEQRFGLAADQRSDLFSLGVLTYELLTGQMPNRTYRSAEQLNRRLPGAIDDLLRRALARQPSDRFQSVAEFNRQLQAVLRPFRPTANRKLPFVVLGTLLLLIPLLLYLLNPVQRGGTRNLKPSTVGASAATQPKCWLLYDEAQTLNWFGELGRSQSLPGWAASLQRLQPTIRNAREAKLPAGARLSRPWPVMVLQSSESSIFVHPSLNSSLAAWVGAHWRNLIHAPIGSEENFVRNGDFSQATDFQQEAHNWRYFDPPEHGDLIRIEAPQDTPENPALHLIKQNKTAQRWKFGLKQKLDRVPERPGESVVLRFRARGEHGRGSLLLDTSVPLSIPREDTSPAAERFRAVTASHPRLEPRTKADIREYRPIDWVVPGPMWRTYAIVWDWPEYSTVRRDRYIELLFFGSGNVWVDDIALFTWDQGTDP